MSEENTEQAVVEEPKDQAMPDTAGDDARDDGGLEALLKEFDEKTQPAAKSEPEPTATATDPDVKSLAAQISEMRTERVREQARRDMDAIVKDIRGDLDADIFDDGFVEAWVDAQARKDMRLQRAWETRHDNPKQFQRVVKELGRQFTAKFGKMPDRQATEDRTVVAHAVRGASTKAPEGKAPSFSGMSDSEYRETVKKEYGFDPGV